MADPQNPETRKRVTIVTDVMFWSANRGSCHRIGAMVDYLRRQFEVDVFFVGQLSIGDWHEAEDVLHVPIDGPSKPGRLLSTVARSYKRMFPAATDTQRSAIEENTTAFDEFQLTLEEFESEVIGLAFNGHVTRVQPAAVIIEYVTLAYLLDFMPELPQPAQTFIDTHDVMSRRLLEFQKFKLKHWLDIDQPQEVAALNQADAAIAIQEEEAQLLTSWNLQCEILVAKHSMSVQVAGDSPKRGSDDPVRIGFLGSAGIANRFGISEFFMRHWPHVVNNTKRPVELCIAGTICNELPTRFLDSNRNVKVVGQIADVSEFFESIDIAINPAMIASGFKIKSLEALAHGVPLVTTPAGGAGLGIGC